MVVLARVDQRLIHGLIVNQWAPHLQVKRFMVVDDVLCNNEEIKASMRMAKPAGTGVSVISTETAITNFKAGKYDGQRVFVLVKEPETLIRLDMSEFMEKHTVSRLIGSPPGYVGYDEAGQLTEKIRRKPYSVILFDEIEKAHPDVLNILLQILDDGEITDAHGRKVNFENTVIVMTSNAGSDKAAGSVGFGRSADDQGRERTMKALREFLRPEFINRVDEIVYFHQLSEENFTAIARIMLNELQASLKEKGYSFSYDDALVSHLVHSSYSAAYGARNLRRCIQKELEDPMAVQIIDSFEHPITQLRATAEDGKVRLDTL